MTAIFINQWKLLPHESRLYKGKKKIELQPKCSELLNYLAERPGQVISKETLLDVIWDGRVVGEDVLTSCIRKIRKVLNDNAKSPHVIETINKKGYRLIANVRLPKTQKWWLTLLMKATIALFLVATVSFYMTHSHISIYQFSNTDSVQERQRKLEEMAGIINENPEGTHSLKISLPN